MLITPERSLVSGDPIEALECLQAWWNNGLIKRPEDEGNMDTSSVFYKQIYPSLLHHSQFPNPAGV